MNRKVKNIKGQAWKRIRFTDVFLTVIKIEER